ncbi:MAG TPA: hypothetical protein VIF62_16280 [Labilithrix sp.]|jgi:hypothetical protein
MKCPSCRRELACDSAPGGDPLYTSSGRHVRVGSARCPYPQCATTIYAFSEGGVVTDLLDARRTTRAYTRRAVADLAASLSAAFVALTFVAGPIAAVRAALLHPTRGSGSLLVVLGGTVLVVPAAAFLVLGAVALVQQWNDTRRACRRVTTGAGFGLRVAPAPSAYRAH